MKARSELFFLELKEINNFAIIVRCSDGRIGKIVILIEDIRS